ncbi:MAG: class I SAM-dependent methyltransferase [Hyphomicrobiales bacterium]|nr:class I SAM-dependent methyltransferase [Hyphomicrobiales bacterium]
MTELLTVRSTCRLCGSERLLHTIPLAEVPIVSPNVGTEKDDAGQRLTRLVAPLDTYLCQDCGLLQLIHVVDPALIYRNYLYRTAVSMGLPDHFHRLSQAMISRIGLEPGDLVVEFGSNDGTLLGHFAEAGLAVQGVDPAVQIATEATARGVPTHADFFGTRVARQIVQERGRAKAVIANNAMANIDDLGEILAGVRDVLAPDGVFVFETQYALDVLEKTLLDVIYHEHISTFSVQPVVRAFADHGLTAFDAERIATKGGSIRFWIQHERGHFPVADRVQELIALEQRAGLYDPVRHKRFADKVAAIKTELHRLVRDAKQSGGQVAAYGTSVGCAALIHQFELEDKLDMLFDDTPFKERLDGPGYDLPVYTGGTLAEHDPALVIVLAWRYADPITAKQAAYLEGGGQFVVPLPEIATAP